GQLEAIEKLIAQLDAGADSTPPQTVAVTRIIRVHTGDAAALVPAITQATSDHTTPGEPLPRLAITADAGSSSLVVTGAPDDVQRAVELVAELDAQPKNEPRQVH